MDYLRNLESDLGDNTNAIRVELNKLEEAGLLLSFVKGNKKYFQSNSKHPLFSDIQSILMKIMSSMTKSFRASQVLLVAASLVQASTSLLVQLSQD